VKISTSIEITPVPNGGWEPNVATAFDDVFVTGNWFAGYSRDGGASWVKVSPYDMQKGIDGGFCCDQRILYIPQINRFAWVLLSESGGDGENEITLAIAEPGRLHESKGRSWVRYHIRPGNVGRRAQWFDYPDISFGDSYLYVTANIGGGLIARLPLGELAQATTVNMQFVVLPQSWICPVQSSGAKGFFGAHTSTSSMRVWSWPEPTNAGLTSANIAITTIRTDDWPVALPSGAPPGEQLFGAGQSPDNEITGAARLRNELWFAWMEARQVAGNPPGARSFPFPHINTAVVSATSLTLLRQERIWSTQRAYGWPTLTANNTEVALVCIYGGIDRGAEICVGLLTPPRELQLVTSGNLGSAGWHYLGVRPAYFSTTAFGAVGYTRRLIPPTQDVSRPRYVVFERS
jgi:hypothetical protein